MGKILGISDAGDFEDVIRIDDLMQPIKTANFRSLYHKLVYIRCPEIVKKIAGSGLEIDDSKEGVIAYGYIDEQCGLSFQVFSAASVEDGLELIRGNRDEQVMLLLRRGFVADSSFVDLEKAGLLYPEYDSLIKMIRDNYDTDNEAKERMRRMDFLDGFRNEDYPDDVAVVLYREGLKAEQVWLRCVGITEDKLYGTLLNEPNQDYGIHEGDKIEFVPVKTDDGLLLIAPIER